MPATKIDQDTAMTVIATELCSTTSVPMKQLLLDLKKLDEVLCQTEKFNWDKVGKQLGQTRQQMYRWYHDTHQRKLYGSVSQEDVTTIRQEVEIAL